MENKKSYLFGTPYGSQDNYFARIKDYNELEKWYKKEVKSTYTTITTSNNTDDLELYDNIPAYTFKILENPFLEEEKITHLQRRIRNVKDVLL